MTMKSFLDHNFAGKPWFAQTEPKEVYTFDVKVETLHVLESETPWGDTFEGEGQFRSICDPEGDEFIEDGTYVVPFWACEALQKEVIQSGKTKGWVTFGYKRETEMGDNREGTEVEINTAFFSRD